MVQSVGDSVKLRGKLERLLQDRGGQGVTVSEARYQYSCYSQHQVRHGLKTLEQEGIAKRDRIVRARGGWIEYRYFWARHIRRPEWGYL